MSFSVLPVFLAFVLNRCSVKFFTACRCVLGFTPFSASVLFGLSLVAILVKHPELYPCWLRRVNAKIIYVYELFASLVFIEIGFCLWNSVETFIFFRLPTFLEENCSTAGDYYIRMVESPVGVSVISNFLALSLLLIALHTTRVCNFNLLLRSNGVKKFLVDAGFATTLCKHHRAIRESCFRSRKSFSRFDQDLTMPVGRPQTTEQCPYIHSSKMMCNRSPKLLRSGKKFY